MSSNRGIPPANAVIQIQGRTVGPMLLPAKDPELFIEQFNQTYRSIGLRITRLGTIESFDVKEPS